MRSNTCLSMTPLVTRSSNSNRPPSVPNQCVKSFAVGNPAYSFTLYQSQQRLNGPVTVMQTSGDGAKVVLSAIPTRTASSHCPMGPPPRCSKGCKTCFPATEGPCRFYMLSKMPVSPTTLPAFALSFVSNATQQSTPKLSSSLPTLNSLQTFDSPSDSLQSSDGSSSSEDDVDDTSDVTQSSSESTIFFLTFETSVLTSFYHQTGRPGKHGNMRHVKLIDGRTSTLGGPNLPVQGRCHRDLT